MFSGGRPVNKLTSAYIGFVEAVFSDLKICATCCCKRLLNICARVCMSCRRWWLCTVYVRLVRVKDIDAWWWPLALIQLQLKRLTPGAYKYRQTSIRHQCVNFSKMAQMTDAHNPCHASIRLVLPKGIAQLVSMVYIKPILVTTTDTWCLGSIDVGLLPDKHTDAWCLWSMSDLFTVWWSGSIWDQFFR